MNRALILAANKIKKNLGSLFSFQSSSEKKARVSSIALRVIENKLTYLSRVKISNLEKCIEEIVEFDIPGVFVETGVALGGSAIIIATLIKGRRKFKGYDVFGLIPPPTVNDSLDSHNRYQVIASGQSRGIAGDSYYGYRNDLFNEVSRKFEMFQCPVDQKDVSLIQGKFEETLCFGPSESIAFAHIDCDWYESVKLCFERIAPNVSRGGYIAIDDYFDFEGCRKATDEFLSRQSDFKIECRQENLILKKI